MDLFNTEENPTSKLYPSFLSISPAFLASSAPFSDKSISDQPVNLFSLFHMLSPCLNKTIFFILIPPYSKIT